MTKKYRIMGGGNDNEDDINPDLETTLTASTVPGAFANNMTCYGCEEEGHRKADCQKKSQ